MSRPTHCTHCDVRFQHQQVWRVVMTTPGHIHYATTCPTCNRQQHYCERQPMSLEESKHDTLISRLYIGALICLCLLLASLVWE